MLKLCTLTGIDKRTSFEWVIETASLHPTAEFGILFSATADGSDQRYPDRDFISDYAGAMQSAMVNTALHICGRAVRMFVEGDEEIRNLAARFGRVQLNFNAQHIAFSTSDLDSAIAGFARPVITQHNEANADVTAAITARNHHVLFDASGGRGIHSQEWPSRLPGKLYGFAGGFGHETLMFDLEGAQRASAGQHYWIDMESRLRRDNWLDTSICESVLRLSSEWFDSEMLKARHSRRIDG